MNLATKFVIYMIIVANCEQSVTNTSQVLQVDWMNDVRARMNFEKVMRLLRIRRQDPVVQPEWTSDDGMANLFVDFNVRVTDRKLQETEALRAMIQKTVDKDSYVVELEESDFKNAETDIESMSEPEEASAPDLQSESEPESHSENESLPEAEQESEAEPISDSEPVSDSEPATDSEPVPEPEPVSDPEPLYEPDPVSELEPASKPETPSQPEPISESDSVSETKQEAAPPKPKSQLKSEQKPKDIPKVGVVETPKQKPKKMLFPLAPRLLFKKIGGHDQFSRSFAEWLKKICLPPWCKNGSHKGSFFI